MNQVIDRTTETDSTVSQNSTTFWVTSDFERAVRTEIDII